MADYDANANVHIIACWLPILPRLLLLLLLLRLYLYGLWWSQLWLLVL